jgi:hypothetical protein
MSMQNLGDCPWCGAKISFVVQGGACVCPVCDCRFKRNSSKWKVGIPLAAVLAGLLWFFVPVYGRLAAGLGALLILIITAKNVKHTIVQSGRTDVTAVTAKAHQEKRPENKWITVGIALLLAVVLILVSILILKH